MTPMLLRITVRISLQLQTRHNPLRAASYVFCSEVSCPIVEFQNEKYLHV